MVLRRKPGGGNAVGRTATSRFLRVLLFPLHLECLFLVLAVFLPLAVVDVDVVALVLTKSTNSTV